MIHAYNKEYLSDAMENLGEAFDYAVHAQNLNLNRFSSLFNNFYHEVERDLTLQKSPTYWIGLGKANLLKITCSSYRSALRSGS